MKTNIIMKNVDFNGCYMLWLFLDKYNALLFDLQVKEKSTKLTPEVEEGFNRIAMLAYLSAENNNPKLKQEFEEKKLLKKSTKRVNSHIPQVPSLRAATTNMMRPACGPCLSCTPLPEPVNRP